MDSDTYLVLQVLDRLHSAMTAADTGRIAVLLDEDYSLVHITGYRQPGPEWLEVIRTRQFDYHAIAAAPDTLKVQINGSRAEITGRGVFDATINGMRAPWRLAFAMSLRRTNNGWKFTHGQYSSF